MGVLPKRTHKQTHRVYSFGYCLNDYKPWEVWTQVASLVALQQHAAASCTPSFTAPQIFSRDLWITSEAGL